ncbi:hypothetical protein DFO70_12550 [Cytobacillus firmus]|uniref:Uncharacterized protein n=1 Tax=Cytobacillus firmus TaxID=1399 RepID=A0A366JJ48_CYTFI|nr:hypothetical protein DFO70_12550 [Cytobacillus firmus]
MFKSILLGPDRCDCTRKYCNYDGCPTDDAYGNWVIDYYNCSNGSLCQSTVQQCIC